MRYESENDINLRLKGSLVRKGNEPVLVEDAIGNNKVAVYNCFTGNKEKVGIEDLDLTPVPLGFVLTKNGLSYVSRKPTRKYKQGLTQENMRSVDVLEGVENRVRLHDESMINAIMGVYPSVEEAFQRCRNGEKVVPFSRHWAVANHKDELCVFHKTEVVGYVGDNSVVLSPDKYYLKESLMEALYV